MKYSMNYLRFSLLMGAFVASFSFAGGEQSMPGEWGGLERRGNRPVKWENGSSDEEDVFISSEEQERLDLEGMRQFRLQEDQRERRQKQWEEDSEYCRRWHDRTVSSEAVTASLRRQGLIPNSTPLIRSSPRSVFHTLGQRQEGPRMERGEQAPKKQPRLKFIEYPTAPRTHAKWKDYAGVELITRGAGTVSEADPLFVFMDKGWLRRCHDRWIIKREAVDSGFLRAYYFNDIVKSALKALWSESPLKRKAFRDLRARIKEGVNSEFLRMLHLLAGRKRGVPGTVVELG
jgi:hypothetical protein